MVFTMGAGTVTATGNPTTSLRACTNAADDYYGGIRVYAKDKGKGASRVMCPATEEDVATAATPREGVRLDRNLNKRNRNRPALEDIWNGFDRNIEPFKLRAAAGCAVVVFMVRPKQQVMLRRVLDNTDGTTANTRFYEIPRRKDNKATKVLVATVCPTDEHGV